MDQQQLVILMRAVTELHRLAVNQQQLLALALDMLFIHVFHSYNTPVSFR